MFTRYDTQRNYPKCIISTQPYQTLHVISIIFFSELYKFGDKLRPYTHFWCEYKLVKRTNSNPHWNMGAHTITDTHTHTHVHACEFVRREGHVPARMYGRTQWKRQQMWQTKRRPRVNQAVANCGCREFGRNLVYRTLSEISTSYEGSWNPHTLRFPNYREAT